MQTCPKQKIEFVRPEVKTVVREGWRGGGEGGIVRYHNVQKLRVLPSTR